jgi:parallel beta-helix repeat protein
VITNEIGPPIKAATITVNDDGGADYIKIQDAINASNGGDTVFVYSGTYNENLVIDEDINLIGESPLTTIIDGMEADSVILVNSLQTYIAGFTITNGTRGIDLPNSDAIIESMIIDLGSYYGIDIGSGGHSPNPTIRNNTILNCSNSAIKVDYGARGIIENNTIYVGSFGCGIRVDSSSPLIIRNTIGTVSGNSQGIKLGSGADVDIVENNIYSTGSVGPYACAVESQYGDADIFNCSFDFPETLQEFVLGYGATLTLHNSTYDSIYYYFEDSDSVVISKWWVDVYINDTFGNPLEGAEVWIENVTGELEYHGFSDSSGRCPLVPITEHIELVDTIITHTPHTFIAAYGTENNSVLSTINHNRAVEIILDVEGLVHNIDKNTYHDTIQGAIDNATAGDTIRANAGTYYENVLVDKSLTLSGVDRDTTIIDGLGLGVVVKITANWVNITEFSITGSDDGLGDAKIYLDNVQHCYIADNKLHSRDNVEGHAVYIDHSSTNTFKNNNITNNDIGFYIDHSNDNYFQDNIISFSYRGFFLSNSTNNYIQYSNILQNFWFGIHVSHSDDNTITDNNLSYNDKGLSSSSSYNNFIYHNNFIYNSLQAEDEGSNYWDNGYPSGGNYWSDYSGADDNSGPNQDIPGSDGIGDTPYDIDSDTQDIYPIVKGPPVDHAPPEIILISPHNNSAIKAGILINLSVTDPNLDFVTFSLNGGASQTIYPPYEIDTSTWSDGNCVIEIYATDTYSSSNTAYYNFIIDSTPPSINLVSPANNSIMSADFEIEFSISDINLNQTLYSKNSVSPTPFSPPHIINTSSWPDGEHNITVYADDEAGNSNEKWFLFTKDTILPEITINSPNNNSLLMEFTTLDFDVFDENLDVIQYSINYASPVNLEEPYDIDTTDWEDGEYRITIYAIDLAGHQNERWFAFRIDTAQPFVISTSPEDEAVDIKADQEIIIEFSESMDCDSFGSAISINPYIEYSCIWSNDNKTLNLNLTEPLEYETYYEISISTQAQDPAGRGLEDKYQFGFTTGSEPKNGDGDEFPIFFLLLALMAVAAAVIVAFLVNARKKKAPGKVTQVQTGSPQTMEVTCSSCNHLLSVNDIGTTMNVACPFCSTPLTVQSQKAAVQMPQLQPVPRL